MPEKIWIANVTLKEMEQMADIHFPLETGGMLLGYWGDNGEGVITRIIGPGPAAKHGRLRFVPDGEYQQALLSQVFKETDGKTTYLGDWHTHPNGRNQLSYLDRRTLAKIAYEPASGTANPLMAILGEGNPKWKLCVVRFHSQCGFILKKYNVTQLLPSVFSVNPPN